MKLRAVARVFLPLTLAAAVCLPAWSQNTAPAKPAADAAGQNAQTLGASTSLDSSSNDVASLYGTPVEEIVARVNDRVITNSDVKRAQAQLAEEARQGSMTLDQYDAVQKNLLRDLIDQQLLLSKGKQLGITGDTELIKRLDDIRKQNHLATLDDLEKAVEQQGTSYEDFKANIRNGIVTQQVVRQEVGSKLEMSQAEIRRYYEDHLASFTQPESIHLNEILIPTNADATPEQLATADAKAKEVATKLKAGGDFAGLAKQYSGGPTAAEGGDLGEFKRGALAKVLEEQTFDLPVGAYTQPIRTRQGYIILQVTKHNPGGTPTMQKVEPQIEQALYMQQIEPAVRAYLTRLRNEGYIDIRPGYTDAGASAGESKPTFTAYVPPQPKKKKKKQRFNKQRLRYGRGAQRKKTTAVASTGSTTGAGAAPAAGSTASTASAQAAGSKPAAGAVSTAPAETASTHSERTGFLRRSKHKNKSKRVKLRYGQAPPAAVSSEQVASASSPKTASPEASAAATGVANGTVQPLGQDLQHTPTITQPKRQKRRFSDEARTKKPKSPARGHHPKVKKVKVDNARPSALTPAEAANQKVESAPLGLDGDTVHKKKKKKVPVKNGEKTRFSDEKKEKQPSSAPATQDSTAPSSSGVPAANPS